MNSLKSLAIVIAVCSLVSTPADAVLHRKNPTATSTITFTDLATFSDAVLHARRTIDYSADAAGDSQLLTVNISAGNFTNFAADGGPHYSVSAPNILPQQATFTAFSLDGQPGVIAFGWDHQINAIATLTASVVGGYHTLAHTLNPGADVDANSNSTSSIKVVLPGDWSVAGNAPGNHRYTISSLWTVDQDFEYGNGQTIFAAHINNFTNLTSQRPNLQFELIGAPVPEPTTWLTMGLGLAVLALRTRSSRMGRTCA